MGEIQQNLDVGFPKNKYLRIENKNVYYDIKTNKQGCYMSIAEVKGNHKNSILIPKSGWVKFREMKRFKVDDISFNFDINKDCQGRQMIICI